jgi:hypothetical protein
MQWLHIPARIIASSCVFCISVRAEDAAIISQPNVVLIVTDDQGMVVLDATVTLS